MALNPASKRKSGFPGQQNSAAARKRAKTFDARSLAVQSSEAALSTTGDLDAAAYLKAREFEIRSLESGIQRSKAALTSRAFQQVPRSLRRRTASHNVKRVPGRLRARAKREMVEDNTPTVTSRRRKPTEMMRIRLETARRLQNLNSKSKAKRAALKAKTKKEDEKELKESGGHPFNIAPRIPKIKKYKLSRPPPAESKFKKRQRIKTWLPTHMFHAKRAHMATSKDPLWRFAVPLTPTEKSYRPTHRASGARGAVAWDMSYISTIQLEGTEGALESVLKAVGVVGEEAWGLKGKKWRAGVRSLRAWVFEQESQRRPIAPVTLIQCARKAVEDVEMVDASDENGKDRPKQDDKRKMFIRVHPSAFLQLWNELLGVSKKQHPPVMVEDLRFEIGSIDITGPGSTEALISALHPFTPEGKQIPAGSPEATWNALLGVTNPSSLPQNALLSFPVTDPRLHFPPRTLKPPSSEQHMQGLARLLASWPPDKDPLPPALFDRPTRLAATRQLLTQKTVYRRRTEAGPGQYPLPQASDPQIPVIALATRNTSQPKNSNSPGTWTVLLPWKCVLPVWYSLMYYPLSSGGNLRFGGLKEQQQLAFEAGEPWFPGDFPGTRAGWKWGLREREAAKREWERRPKGRRVEFDSLDLGNSQKGEIGRGWACDWERLVKPSSDPVSGGEQDPTAEKEQVTKKGDEKPTEAQESSADPPSNIHQLLPPPQANLAINKPSLTIPSSALTTVKITLRSRGSPTPRARIYRLPTNNPDLRQKWISLASKKPPHPDSLHHQDPSIDTISNEDTGSTSQRLAASLLAPTDPSGRHTEHLPSPSEEDLIGFVTTGNYNLSEGKGTGVGSILVSKVRIPARKDAKGKSGYQGKNKGDKEGNMCIVRSAGESVGRLGFWDVV
ncbi:ribonucleases P/MRP protein subunit POP1-domain-containing protein [Aspergillus cavernicola]|uniref:Ribonucleases P/MRP protein subunit POP1-domain-containing protein n=1 Tax=Aspergillus cavernicola TaxID=176166 RepID=A0ABR4ITM1_9EURO